MRRGDNLPKYLWGNFYICHSYKSRYNGIFQESGLPSPPPVQAKIKVCQKFKIYIWWWILKMGQLSSSSGSWGIKVGEYKECPQNYLLFVNIFILSSFLFIHLFQSFLFVKWKKEIEILISKSAFSTPP